MTACGVCSKDTFDLLWDLPRLPLTEKYGTYRPDHELYHDQQLFFCEHCGHVQLGKQISPELLYTPTEYSFRTSQSKSARTGSDLFFQFFSQLKGSKAFNCLLDIGGNDLYLAKMVDTPLRYVVDPVYSGEDGQVIDNVKVLGKFIEEVDFQKEGFCPDLVFCRHVLEHIRNPREMLTQLVKGCHSKSLFVFEIPCFENLVEANRFDAIFHQHYHYFDLSSFQRLISEVNCEYISHIYYRQGPCGGSLLIAFQRSDNPKTSLPSLHTTPKKGRIKQAIRDYQHQMQLLSRQLKKFNKNIYGYGASLMLATLAYHLETDFSELICVLDDDQDKDNIGYQNLPVKVCYSGRLELKSNCNYLITSLENKRSIYRRIVDLSPRRILLPLIN